MNSNKNLMKSKMKYLLSLISLVCLFCSALTSEPARSEPIQIKSYRRVIYYPDTIDYSFNRQYFFFLTQIKILTDSSGQEAYVYFSSEGSETPESYLARLFKGTKYASPKPSLVDVMRDIEYGDREALLLLSALSHDAYKQVTSMANYSVYAFDPLSDSIILTMPFPDDDAAGYVRGYFPELKEYDPWLYVMVDGYLRSRSEDSYWLRKPGKDRMLEDFFHRRFLEKSKIARENIERYNKMKKK